MNRPIQRRFNAVAEQYGGQRRALIPCFHFIEQDPAWLAPGGGLPENGFGLIVSALTIRHSDNPQKQTLFRQTARLPAPHGRFLNADQVLGETEAAGLPPTLYFRHYSGLK